MCEGARLSSGRWGNAVLHGPHSADIDSTWCIADQRGRSWRPTPSSSPHMWLNSEQFVSDLARVDFGHARCMVDMSWHRAGRMIGAFFRAKWVRRGVPRERLAIGAGVREGVGFANRRLAPANASSELVPRAMNPARRPRKKGLYPF